MSSKTTAQPGRRTPLSLSGSVIKNQSNKGGNIAVNGSGNSANGHATSNVNKQDNKLQQQKNDQAAANNADTKEYPNKKPLPQADKKQQQNENKKSNEKSQNGVTNNKHQQSNENKQQQQTKEKSLPHQQTKEKSQQQNKEKSQQQNGNDDNKLNEKDKKEKIEKSNNLEKLQVKSEKEINESKILNNKVEKDKRENETEEKKAKEVKDTKDEKKDDHIKNDVKTEQQVQIHKDEEKQIKSPDKKNLDENTEKMDLVEEQNMQQKSIANNIIPPKNNTKASRTPTPVNKTPTKVTEKTPQKMTPTSAAKVIPVTKRQETTTIDDNDVEMEPLAIENSPAKSSQPEEGSNINTAPAATSTPGKIILPNRNSGVLKSDVQLSMQTGISPERPRAFSQISGRKSIRPISDYTPSKFQSNLQFRESYRRINTELDVTNTSMNVTVGSEITNNLSFSFFGRGRKRDRTSPPSSHLATGEVQTDIEISPPKKPRLDMHGFFSVVSSPLTLLRNRFSKASLQSSTPVKKQQKLNTAQEEIEVQNVSGVSLHEEMDKSEKEFDDADTTLDDDNGSTLGEDAKLKLDVVTPASMETNSEEKELKDVSLEKTCGRELTFQETDTKNTGTQLHPVGGDPIAKNKKCVVM